MAKMIDNTKYGEMNSVTALLKDIDKKPQLTREEEYYYGKKAFNGDVEARNKLVEANLKFVVSVAKQYQNKGIPLSDLINEGIFGLITAAEKFDPDMGYHFISYAVWWIKQSIMKAISEKVRMIRLPMNKNADLMTLQKAKHQFEQETGENATVKELSSLTNFDEDTVKTLLAYSEDVSSLDAPIGDGENGSLFGDMLASDQMSPDEQTQEASINEVVNRALSKLNDKERKIIELRFGFNNQKRLSLKEIGDLFNLTKERIRQIEKKVLTMMANDEQFAELKDLVA